MSSFPTFSRRSISRSETSASSPGSIHTFHDAYIIGTLNATTRSDRSLVPLTTILSSALIPAATFPDGIPTPGDFHLVISSCERLSFSSDFTEPLPVTVAPRQREAQVRTIEAGKGTATWARPVQAKGGAWKKATSTFTRTKGSVKQ